MKEYEQKICNIIDNMKAEMRYQCDKVNEQAYKQGHKRGYAEGYEIGKHDGYEDGKADTPFTDTEEAENKAYNRGLNEAWEAARKLCQSVKYGGLEEYCNEIFGKTPFETFDVFDYTASEAIAKIKAYEDKQKQDAEIEVGDEVAFDMNNSNDRGIVTRIVDTRNDTQGALDAYVLWGDGSCGIHSATILNKTGHTHTQIAEVLAELRGEDKQKQDDWRDIPSDEMTLEQARRAVKELRAEVLTEMRGAENDE